MSDRAYIVTYQDGRPRRCMFPCQKIGEDGQRIRRECSVSVDPDFSGKTWALTGAPDAPTLSPSIDCLSKPCWHGFIVNGEVLT
jgi:hypothetical protein